MCQGWIKDKQILTIRVSDFKDLNGRSYLNHQLFIIPPRITMQSWINDLSCILDTFSIFIQEHKSSILFINEVRDMNQSALTLLVKWLFPWAQSKISSFIICMKAALIMVLSNYPLLSLFKLRHDLFELTCLLIMNMHCHQLLILINCWQKHLFLIIHHICLLVSIHINTFSNSHPAPAKLDQPLLSCALRERISRSGKIISLIAQQSFHGVTSPVFCEVSQL